MAKIVFFGTPRFGVPVLQALIEHHDIVLVVSQPDRLAGRGRRHRQLSPVKQIAQAHGLRMLQPARLRRDPEAVARLRQTDADLFVIAAYGQILRPNILEIPRHGCIGVHASLLPELRGAAPIAAAILQGKVETGVTLMLTDAGMDTGPIITQGRLPIAPDDTTETLSEKLAYLGAKLLIQTLPAWLAGEIVPRPQDDALATSAPQIKTSDGCIDWRRTALEIDRQIRAYTPWPGSFCACDAKRFKILRAHPLPAWRGEGLPGNVMRVPEGIGVVTGQGLLLLDEVQLAGKKPMSVEQFCQGQRAFVNSILS